MTGPRSRGGQGQLRIIGGRWRGRKLHFQALDGLRPTGDRIRETLFNWLAASIDESRCVDLFAGSGALGLEALSRGAAHCDFVDISPRALEDIRSHVATLGAQASATCHAAAAEQFLGRATGPYDLVFVDPPFSRELVAPVCRQLEERGLLAPASLVYVETAAKTPEPAVPGGWHKHREKISGQVAYRLYRTR